MVSITIIDEGIFRRFHSGRFDSLMKKENLKIQFVLIGIVSLFALYAIIMAGEIFRSQLKRHNFSQINQQHLNASESSQPSNQGQDDLVVDPSKIPPLNSFLPENLFYNGMNTSFSAYGSSQFGLYLPVDRMIQLLGGRYSFYNSDILFSAEWDEYNILLKLGSSNARITGKNLSMPSAVISRDGSVLASFDLFERLGLTQDSIEDKNGKRQVFLYNASQKEKQAISNVTWLERKNGKIGLNSVSGTVIQVEAGKDAFCIPCPGQMKSLIIDNGNGFIFDGGVRKIEFGLQEFNQPRWSYDGKFLFYQDSKMMDILLAIETGKSQQLGDYTLRYLAEHPQIADISKITLYSYCAQSGYKVVVLSDTSFFHPYVFVEKDENPILQGEAYFSPDGGKVIVKVANTGFYIMNRDGTDAKWLSEGSDARWVHHYAILVENNGEQLLFTRSGQFSEKITGVYYFCGIGINGEALHVRNLNLMLETGQKTQYLRDLDISPERIIQGRSNDFFFVIPNNDSDPAEILSEGKTLTLCKRTNLIKENRNSTNDFLPSYMVQASKDGLSFAYLEKSAQLFGVTMVDAKTLKKSTFFLGVKDVDSFSMHILCFQWLDDQRIIIMTPDQIFIINKTTGEITEDTNGKDEKNLSFFR